MCNWTTVRPRGDRPLTIFTVGGALSTRSRTRANRVRGRVGLRRNRRRHAVRVFGDLLILIRGDDEVADELELFREIDW
jgi:hypothetical protein